MSKGEALDVHLIDEATYCGEEIGGLSDIKLRFFGSRIPRLDLV